MTVTISIAAPPLCATRISLRRLRSRFDSGSTFGRLLDWDRGGHCTVAPAKGKRWKYSREYLGDTLVLATNFQGPGGEVRLLDAVLMGPWTGS